ncbi:N-acetyltransferase family protein [Aestuariibius sp. HNIBRBA575]|uniref:GNAT family N-acetyltransferase n=1 Tax=Aestuariibius sp. HNIBRBA575 TaxID=3233343 RepID=UPI0034A20E85
MNVRPARVTDAKTIAHLTQGLCEHHGDTSSLTAETIASLIDQAGFLTFATCGDPVVGYVAYYRVTQLHAQEFGLYVHHLYVEPDARGQGIGQKLMTYVEQQALAGGMTYVQVSADPDNQMASAYLSMDYEESPPNTARRFLKNLKSHP